jgi:hypothetical protein
MNHVVINDATEDTWAGSMWSDIKSLSIIHYDNNTIKCNILRKLHKLHFSNKINRKVWLPFKFIWDPWSSVKLSDIFSSSRVGNIVIFQSSVKFSPRYILKLKQKGAKIILYLPDTLSALGIANNRFELQKYLERYHIDSIYSFDPFDCYKYALNFFDLYSVEQINSYSSMYDKISLLYVGNVRSDSRLHLLNQIFEYLHNKCKCMFYINGVDESEMKYPEEIIYNCPIPYKKVIELVTMSNCILEIVNIDQTGSSLRFKEAIVYNKKLLTNNINVQSSRFYSSSTMLVFKNVDEIDSNWIVDDTRCNYEYSNDFSPRTLLSEIIRSSI